VAESSPVEMSMNPTPASFAEIYMEKYAKKSLAVTTQDTYRKTLDEEKHGLIAFFGERQLAKIDNRHVQDYVDMMVDEGLNPKTIKNHVMLLNSIFTYAMKYGYLERKTSPCYLIDMPKYVKKKIKAYSPDEIQKLLGLVNEANDMLLSFSVYCGIGLGLRRSEVAALTIDSFDMDRRCVNITQACVRANNEYHIKAPKSVAGNRTIFMSDEVYKVVKQMIVRYNKNRLKHGKKFNDSRFLLSDEYGNPKGPTHISNTFAKFVKKHSEELPPISYHGLRHTFASNLITVANADVVSVKELMGHSDINMTLGTYSHSFDERKIALADAMNQVLSTKLAVNG